jgi:hypothetical protein
LYVSFYSNATNFGGSVSGDYPFNVYMRGPLGF